MTLSYYSRVFIEGNVLICRRQFKHQCIGHAHDVDAECGIHAALLRLEEFDNERLPLLLRRHAEDAVFQRRRIGEIHLVGYRIQGDVRPDTVQNGSGAPFSSVPKLVNVEPLRAYSADHTP